MITLLISFFIAFTVSNMWPQKAKHYKWQTPELMYPWALGVFYIFLVLTTITTWAVFYSVDNDWTVYKTPIVAMNDGYVGGGRTFTVRSQEYYYYYTPKNGGYTMGKIEANGVVIYEDEENTPFVGRYVKKINDWKTYVFSLPFPEQKTEIHVPKGSVKIDFNFDLSN